MASHRAAPLSFSIPAANCCIMEKGPNDAFYAGIAHAQNKEVALDVERVPTKNTDFSADRDVLPDGLIAPTEEELETLRHVAGHVNWSTYSERNRCASITCRTDELQ